MVRLSPKHGVNPAIPNCFYCNEPKNEIILFGRIPGKLDIAAPMGKVWDKEPCDNCKHYMERGIILISVRDGEEGQNPYRTGKWCVVTEDFIRRNITPPELAADLLKKRVSFVPDKAWAALELPTGPVPEKT